MCESKERKRMSPWLKDQINSGKIPGLRWLDPEHTTFRVPWKHAGKPDFDLEKDAVLFREYARHTNRYQEGDQPDPSTWKTRFRCALHKMPNLEEVKIADSLDEKEPYRVFKFLQKNERKTASPTKGSPDTTSSSNTSAFFSFTGTRQNDMSYASVENNGCHLDTNDWSNIEPTLPPISQWNIPPCVTTTCCSPSYSEAGSSLNQWEGGMIHSAFVTSTTTTKYDDDPVEMGDVYWTSGVSEHQAKLIDFVLKKELTALHNTTAEVQGITSQSSLMTCDGANSYDLLIKAFYDNEVVVEDKVRFQNRLRMCRLYYGQYDATFNIENSGVALNTIYGPAAAEQFPLPKKEVDVPEIRSVLENMNRGLVLELSESRDIYALRLCRCKVFYSSGSQQPRKLEREAKTKVFDYEGGFVPALCNSLEGFCATPSYEVTFTLGYPNGSLVTIVITHAHAKKEFQSHGSNENLCSEPNANDEKAMDFQQCYT